MYLEQRDLNGNPFLGVFTATNDKVTFVPKGTNPEFKELLETVLKTEVVEILLCNSSLIGVFMSMNNKAAVLPENSYVEEKDELSSFIDAEVVKGFTAVGNMVTANDKGGIISPLFSDTAKAEIESVLGVKIEKSTVANLDTPGSCVVATNKGFFSNSNTSDEEIQTLQESFQVEGGTGTLNYGNPFVKGGIIANTNGAVVGSITTPFELGRLDDALFFKK